jgi:hypothetical protein
MSEGLADLLAKEEFFKCPIVRGANRFFIVKMFGANVHY